MASHMPRIPVGNLLCLIHKRFLQTSALSSPSPPSFSLTAQYLTDSCGLRLESAIPISQKFQFDEESRRKSDSVLNLLRAHGFDDAHISQLVEKYPRVLRCRAMTNLKPKFEFLSENGFKGVLLPELILANPALLLRSLDSNLKPVVEFLKKLIPTDEEFFTAVRRSTWLLSTQMERFLQPKVNLLIYEGVPVNCISTLLIRSPRTLLQSYDRMAYAVKTIKSLGIEVQARKFIRALRVYSSVSNLSWKKKLEAFKSLGWSNEEALTAFKNEPFCFACSEEKLRTMMDFFMTTVKLEQKTIISNPKILGFSMDKRVRPRYEIMKLLESKNLIKEDEPITKFLTLSEKNFMAEYITKHEDKIPGLFDMYNTSSQLKKNYEEEKLIV